MGGPPWRIPYPLRLVIRAVGDSSVWLARHYRWKVPTLLAGAVVGAIIQTTSDKRWWEVVALAVVSGLSSLAVLWLGSFVIHLILAPGRLRRLEAIHPLKRRGAMLLARIEPTTRKTELARRAADLIPSIRRLSENKANIVDRDPINWANLEREYQAALQEVELFGDLVRLDKPESGTRAERVEARRLYESIRAFPLSGDLEVIQDLLRGFAKPERESWFTRTYEALRRWWMRLWIQVS